MAFGESATGKTTALRAGLGVTLLQDFLGEVL